MQKKVKVCIVIPAYNESSVIGKVVSNAISALKKEKGFNSSIIVVNDSSTDNTSIVAKKAGAIVVNHILNTGAGGATATGLRYAEKNNFDIAATMDGDGQHHIDDVLKGIKKLHKNKTDLLIGSRLVDSTGMSKVKVIGNTGLSTITYLLFGVYSTDSQSGLRIFSRKALVKLKWKTTGYEFCSEMLWRAKQQGLVIAEYPIKAIYTEYSKAKGQNNWNAINILKVLLKRRVLELFYE